MLAKSLYPEWSTQVFKAQTLTAEQKSVHLPFLNEAKNMKQAWQEEKDKKTRDLNLERKEGNIVKEPEWTVYNLIWMKTAGKSMAWKARPEESRTGENGISFSSLEHSLLKTKFEVSAQSFGWFEVPSWMHLTIPIQHLNDSAQGLFWL